MLTKGCAKCGAVKSIDEFHKQPSGQFGRHSYCKMCANEYQRASRVRNYSPEQSRKWQLKGRYGLTEEDVAAMISAQGGRCAICTKPLLKPCIDHAHDTGKVRGILCHGCNIKLPAIEVVEFRDAALRYLEGYA